MSFRISRVEYFYATVEDVPGESYKVLQSLASLGVNMHAFTTLPVGLERTQLQLFPTDTHRLKDAAKKAGMQLDGPHRAILVQGDDELGALTSVHERLYRANVNLYASTGVSDGKGMYGYIIYIRPEEYERAAQALAL